MKNLKIVFITGGVSSSLGKGITASILSGLLISRGYKVKLKKIDPYLNIDPGTLSPIEHGEVFVTDDGVETDLDLGHYERLGCVITSKDDYITSGMIFNKLLIKERRGEYNGKTVQVIPHFTSKLRESIFKGTDDYDFLICEVGGTVGDMESNFIIETIRQIKFNIDNVAIIHLALLPYLKKAQEWKTKPVQHSVWALLERGLSPDLLLCRMEEKNNDDWKKKISSLCSIKVDSIFEALDSKTIYHAMKEYEEEGICQKLLEFFKLKISEPKLEYLYNYLKVIDSNLDSINIAVVGKYTQCKDAYKSIEEALDHAAFSNKVKLNVHVINAENLKEESLKNMHGILIPGGFGARAIEGKLLAISYAKNNNIPMLGMCLGMQLSIIDGLRDLYDDADSSEFSTNTNNPVIIKLDEWYKENQICKLGDILGGTMRLGSYAAKLDKESLTYKLYGSETIAERHRHRYVFNKKYLKDLEKVGIKVVGVTIDEDQFVEIIERPSLDFFVAGQFHAEFKSNIKNPHPLFVGFIKAAKNIENKIKRQK